MPRLDSGGCIARKWGGDHGGQESRQRLERLPTHRESVQSRTSKCTLRLFTLFEGENKEKQPFIYVVSLSTGWSLVCYLACI